MTDKITINVAGIDPDLWRGAKAEAGLAGETVAQWLNRAMEQKIKTGKGDALFLPTPNVPNASPNPPIIVDLQEIAAVVTAMRGSGIEVQKRVGTKLNALLYLTLKEATTPPPASQIRLIEAPKEPKKLMESA